VFSKDGDFKYHFGVAGKEEGQMWYPRKVAVIRQSGKIVVCDRGSERSRMQIFTRNGQFIKRIVIRLVTSACAAVVVHLHFDYLCNFFFLFWAWTLRT